jgi:hypothetical protein
VSNQIDSDSLELIVACKWRRIDHPARLGMSGMVWVKKIRNFYPLLVEKREQESLPNILVVRYLNWSRSLCKVIDCVK